MKKLQIADTDMIRKGDVADVYFARTEEILRKKGIRKSVVMEVYLKSFPEKAYRWGVFAGLEEVCTLMDGRDVSIWSMPEGTVFFPRTPVMVIEGDYLQFGDMETAILGCLCQASGIATKASRFRIAAGDRGLMSFGARRIHPAIAPMVERAAFIGGCDGVATIAGARLIGEKPVGTMPHALILLMGDTLEAARAFDEIIEEDVPRIALIDTFQDEKFEAIRLADDLQNRIFGMRLDTPSSRRGSFRGILEEVRWELDLRGHRNVRLVVSGGLSVEDVLDLQPIVDSFGVGTSIASAATLDFSMDIVEIDGKPCAKRGKESGRKDVLRCPSCMKDFVVPAGGKAHCGCPGTPEPLLVKVMESGRTAVDLPAPRQIRERCLSGLSALRDNIPPKELLRL
jgi:nicotinate phosphoribosyltransferase